MGLRSSFSTLSKFFFVTWFLCLVVFITLFALETNFFKNMVFNTSFGNSDIVVATTLWMFVIGVFSFLLAIFFRLMLFIGRRFKVLLPVFISIFVIVLALIGKFFFVIFINMKPTPVSTSLTPTPTYYVIPTITPTPRPRVLDGGKLFNLVNKYRSDQRLSQLQWFHSLCEYSKKRSQEVSTDWSHEGFLDDSQNRLIWQYCPDCIGVGENLAEGYFTEEAILQGWIESPSHKDNLDRDWTYACAYFYGNSYVSMIFGKVK